MRVRTSFSLILLSAFAAAAQAPSLSPEAKKQLEQEVTQRVTRMAFVPGVDFSSWPKALEKHRAAIDAASTPDTFAGAINGALGEFKQSHLAVISPEQSRARRTGARAGVGVLVEQSEAGLLIREAVRNSPADRAGLKGGETITLINGKKPTSIGDLAGPVGTEFTLTVKGSDGKIRQVVVKREVFSTREPESLRWIVPNKIVVFRVPTFEQSYTSKRVNELITEANPAHTMILDLRNNPGGFIFNMLHLAGLLLPEGSEMGTMVYRYGVEKFTEETGKPATDLKAYAEWAKDGLQPLRPSPTAKRFGGRVLVLTNAGTGSAAEMMTASLRDVTGSKSFGSRTAGQVLAAMITPLSHDFSMIVPIQDYITARGVRLEGTGVVPDFPVEGGTREDDKVLKAAVEYANAHPR